MEDHATAAWLWCELDVDVGHAQTVDDAFRPREVHAAGHVPMIGGHGAIRTIPQADRPVLFDERLVPGAIKDLDETLPGPIINRVADEPMSSSGPDCGARFAGGSCEYFEAGSVGNAPERDRHQVGRAVVVTRRQRDLDGLVRSSVQLCR